MNYYDRDGNPISLDRWVELSALPFDDYSRIAFTQITDWLNVSTVWLGLDHGFDTGPPLIFETMSFYLREEPIEAFGMTTRTVTTSVAGGPP